MNISPSEPLWLHLQDVLEIHREQIEPYGGEKGIRDAGLLESAQERSRNLFWLNGEEDILALAVRLGAAIAKNHPFIDGNKRTGAAAMIEFLAINGYWLDLPNDTRLGQLFEQTVADLRSEDDLYAGLIPHLQPWDGDRLIPT